MKIAAILFVLVGCVAVTIVQTCEEEVAQTNTATLNKMKSEREKILEQKAAILDMIKSKISDLSEKDIAQYRNVLMRGRQAAERAKSNYKPMSTAQILERGEQIRANLQAASPRTNYRSMEDTRKGVNAQHAGETNAAHRVQVLDHQQNHMNSEAKSATVDEEEAVNQITVDTEDIIQHAKMAVERAKSLPSSFKEWKEHLKQKMAAAAKANTHQEVATKNAVQNNNIRVAASPVNRYTDTSHKDLVNEIEAERETAAVKPQPYLMPFDDKNLETTKQAETMHSHQPHPVPIPRKEWEDMVQARIEALKGNPQKWEEIKKRVEQEKANFLRLHPPLRGF